MAALSFQAVEHPLFALIGAVLFRVCVKGSVIDLYSKDEDEVWIEWARRSGVPREFQNRVGRAMQREARLIPDFEQVVGRLLKVNTGQAAYGHVGFALCTHEVPECGILSPHGFLRVRHTLNKDPIDTLQEGIKQLVAAIDGEFMTVQQALVVLHQMHRCGVPISGKGVRLYDGELEGFFDALLDEDIPLAVPLLRVVGDTRRKS